MSAAEVLAELVTLGAEVGVDGEGLYVDAAGELAPDLVARVRAHKPALLRLLATWEGEAEGWPPELRYLWQERAGIMADAGVPDAERAAALDTRASVLGAVGLDLVDEFGAVLLDVRPATRRAAGPPDLDDPRCSGCGLRTIAGPFCAHCARPQTPAGEPDASGGAAPDVATDAPRCPDCDPEVPNLLGLVRCACCELPRDARGRGPCRYCATRRRKTRP